MGNYWLDLDDNSRLEEEVKEFMDRFKIWDNIQTWEEDLTDGDLVIWYDKNVNGITKVYGKWQEVLDSGQGHPHLIEKGTPIHQAIAEILSIHYETKGQHALEKEFEV
jgi:hypothetical protein